jgi:hypothetical protein
MERTYVLQWKIVRTAGTRDWRQWFIRRHDTMLPPRQVRDAIFMFSDATGRLACGSPR